MSLDALSVFKTLFARQTANGWRPRGGEGMLSELDMVFAMCSAMDALGFTMEVVQANFKYKLSDDSAAETRSTSSILALRLWDGEDPHIVDLVGNFTQEDVEAHAMRLLAFQATSWQVQAPGWNTVPWHPITAPLPENEGLIQEVVNAGVAHIQAAMLEHANPQQPASPKPRRV